jgi:hypothetical protein
MASQDLPSSSHTDSAHSGGDAGANPLQDAEIRLAQVKADRTKFNGSHKRRHPESPTLRACFELAITSFLKPYSPMLLTR